MLDALIRTMAGPGTLTNPVSGNITASSFTARVPTITKPSGDGIIAFGDQGTMAANAIKLAPFGVGTNGQTFTMKVFGWHTTPGGVAGAQTFPLWWAEFLASFTCTLNTSLPGVATSDVAATNFFCSTIVLVTGNSGISVEVVSPGGNDMAHVVVDVKGAQLVQTDFAVVNATSAQALWRKL